STFGSQHFVPTEVVSSDRCRALIADDETDQTVTREAFDLLYAIVGKRLATRRLAVVDATNVRPEDRAKGVEVARRYHALPVAIVLDVPPELAAERNRSREDRRFGAKVVYDQTRLLRKSLRSLRREGYRSVYVLDSPEAIADVEIVREPLYNDRRNEAGPFDIIGDIHGCYDELVALLQQLGYARDDAGTFRHPEGRRAIFLGDLVDRGPKIVEVLELVMNMTEAGAALCVPGNHEIKLKRKLDGRDVKISYGLAETLEQLQLVPDATRPAFLDRVRAFIDGLVSHYWLDAGKLVVAHAGLRADMQGRGSREVREFALYGESTGETDEFGLPVRYDWARDYRGSAIVAYGHTPVPAVDWVNKTVCLDTGCVYGGSLTAMRYPELEFASIPALRTYVEPVRPLVVANEQPSAQQHADDVLELDDVVGKRRIETRIAAPVFVPAENAAAALEIASRYCADPRWLIYLPPTMSPPETSQRETLLEHPDEAFAYYRKAGVDRVVIEEKHMGSRAVAIVARDEASARRRFGVDCGAGIVVTRTGRPFFERERESLERTLLE
ncbi:MAG TPA: polynucleotide kinase-phosphatase, partial [Candidatus Tumulicola sp.]